MNKTENMILYITIALLMVFFFLILISAKVMQIDLPDCVPPGTPFQEGKVVQLDDRTYQAYYVSQMWTFEPQSIEIPRGSEVDIYLTTKDVVHGFYIENTNVNLMAVTGAINQARVTFDEPGVYRILCHEYCGMGHQNMQGEIIVY